MGRTDGKEKGGIRVKGDERGGGIEDGTEGKRRGYCARK